MQYIVLWTFLSITYLSDCEGRVVWTSYSKVLFNIWITRTIQCSFNKLEWGACPDLSWPVLQHNTGRDNNKITSNIKYVFHFYIFFVNMNCAVRIIFCRQAMDSFESNRRPAWNSVTTPNIKVLIWYLTPWTKFYIWKRRRKQSVNNKALSFYTGYTYI